MKQDEEIKDQVVSQLKWDNRIDSSSIMVTVDDGKVELKGEVPNYLSKTAATFDTYNVPGVSMVENEIGISPIVDTRPKDVEIERNLRNKYTWDQNLNEFTITPTADNGWVKLEGTVDAYWKIVKAEDIAQDTIGVLGVNNLLAVTPDEHIEDELIAEDIMDAINRDIRISASEVDVKVEDAVVTLNGIVNSYATKTAAYDCAVRTAGVKKVNDNIIVKFN